MGDWIITMCALALGIAIGANAGNDMTNRWWKKEMVERGIAIHNAKTGAWQWVEMKP